MSILDDLLKHETEFVVIERILSVVHLTIRYATPLAEANTLGLARLLVDAAVSVEQAFLSAFRAQPRLGWASMRIAAEALKDLDCIQRDSKLYPLWMGVGTASSTRQSVKAQVAFKEARKHVAHTWTTEVCQTSMRLCSIFGSHPNATSLGTMGSTSIDPVAMTARIPARVTDAENLDWHLDQMIRHATLITAGLAKARLDTLGESDRTELERHTNQLLAAAKPFMEEAVSKLNDEGDGDDPDAC
jgi:hypothetical protein